MVPASRAKSGHDLLEVGSYPEGFVWTEKLVPKWRNSEMELFDAQDLAQMRECRRSLRGPAFALDGHTLRRRGRGLKRARGSVEAVSAVSVLAMCPALVQLVMRSEMRGK